MSKSAQHEDRRNLLHLWLARIDAKLGYQVDAPNGRARLSIYTAGRHGRPFIVTEHLEPAGAGWDIFVSASNENNTVKTLDGAAIALGVEGCRGLIPSGGVRG